MPFGIKGETPEITKKMERCVMKMEKSGAEKSKAIAICKSAIMKSMGKSDEE